MCVRVSYHTSHNTRLWPHCVSGNRIKVLTTGEANNLFNVLRELLYRSKETVSGFEVCTQSMRGCHQVNASCYVNASDNAKANKIVRFYSYHRTKEKNIKLSVEMLHLITVDYFFPLCERSVDAVYNTLTRELRRSLGGTWVTTSAGHCL